MSHLYILAGIVALVFLFYGPGRKWLKLQTWRISAGVGAIAAFAGAVFFLFERKWPAVAVLVVVGLWLASTTRFPRAAKASVPKPSGMSASEARSILGIGPEATVSDVKAAYARLIQSVHPDKGGSAGLAAQLNAARDRLLKK